MREGLEEAGFGAAPAYPGGDTGCLRPSFPTNPLPTFASLTGSPPSPPSRSSLPLRPRPSSPSPVVDPWGSVIARLPDALQTGIAVAELQLGPAGLLHATRDRMPCRQHRDKGRAAYAHGQGREPQQPAPQPGM